jgi:hypothetical protein
MSKKIPEYIRLVVDNGRNFNLLTDLINEQKRLIELQIRYQNEIKSISTKVIKIENIINKIIIKLRGNNERGENNKQL